jgi:hypothetical protein
LLLYAYCIIFMHCIMYILVHTSTRVLWDVLLVFACAILVQLYVDHGWLSSF